MARTDAEGVVMGQHKLPPHLRESGRYLNQKTKRFRIGDRAPVTLTEAVNAAVLEGRSIESIIAVATKDGGYRILQDTVLPNIPKRPGEFFCVHNTRKGPDGEMVVDGQYFAAGAVS